MAAASLLRIAVVQFAPKLGEVHANIAKARELCRGLTPRSVDLVCFPEMIFTGYVFPDAPSIAPYLEHPKTGPTSTFCAELARDLQCYVTAGFPECLEPSSSLAPCPAPTLTPTSMPTTASGTTSAPSHPSLIGANAALLYGPTGHLLHTYHKSNLFPTDLTWARPGPGFTTLDLPAPLGRTAIAICNDVNVNADGAWVSVEGGPYELAGYCKKEGVRTLVLLNAWLRPEGEGGKGGASVQAGGLRRGEDSDGGGEDGDNDGEDGDGDELEPNWQVLNFWSMRLRPLWAKDADAKNAGEGEGNAREFETLAETAQMNGGRELVVVVCNRFGRERGKTFVGSSVMFSMRPGSGRPRLLHVMGEREEGVRVWTARIGPHMLV